MKNCLIVDDSKMIRRVAGRILKDLNFSTRESGDGQDALVQWWYGLAPHILE